jgi:eukaryotic-like serine/threonine-protein kinase
MSGAAHPGSLRGREGAATGRPGDGVLPRGVQGAVAIVAGRGNDAAPTPMPPQVGQVVNNKYRLLRHIGDGGMGSVYEARHETLGTTVALKFLHLEFSRREGLVQRFLQEARASAQIQSPHVVRVSDVDQAAEGDVFIVLEYLEGRTLQTLYEELYRAGRRLPYPEALDYAAQMLDGVEAAHKAGIVHRDLKPDNVMITADPKGAPLLKLLDFGIAKLKVLGVAGGPQAPGLTRPGAMMGTPEYMAPEQAYSADAVDARADIFSLGVIIFEMLAGRRPIGGDDPHDLAGAYRSGRIARLTDLVPTLAPELAAAVHRAIAPLPGDRFPDAAAMREAIEPFASAVRAPSPSRLRAGGTIGVSPVAAEAAPVLAALPGPPPTARGGRPADAPRPGGVAKTWPPDEEPAPAAPPAAPRMAGTVIDDLAPVSAGGDRTQGMPQPYALHPMSTAQGPALGPAANPAPSPGHEGGAPRPPGPRRKRRSGPSVLSMLLLAAGVAGLVTGVVFLATRSSSSSRDDDPPPRSTGVTVTPPQPAPPSDPGEPPAEPPPPEPGPAPGPAPKPSPGTRPRPAPSGAPSAGPTAPRVLVIPSAFPFPNPFQSAPPGSGSPKQQDPPLFPLP